MVFGKRISTLTFEIDREEPVLGLRPGCEKFPVPKDSQDFVLLPQDRVLLGRNGTTLNAAGRLELRNLDEWEPVPYAVLPFVPPILVDDSASRGLVHLPLIEGWESGMAVLDLDRFEEICRLPFTGPFAFIPVGADCYRDEESQVNPSPWSDTEVTTSFEKDDIRAPLFVEPRAATHPRAKMDIVQTGIVATMPHDIADDELIAAQTYADVIHDRKSRTRGGRSCRSPVVVDYKDNVLHRVQRETEGADHILIPDPEAMYVVTENNVYLRRIDLTSGAIDWDLEIGQNDKGEVYTSYATAASHTHLGSILAVGVYDERVDIIDLNSGKRVSQIWLHHEGRSRIASLTWFPGGGMLAIGLANGTVMFAWLPNSFDQDWRLRVFRAADRSLRKIQFHPFGDRLLTLSQDGFLRSWELLEDERSRMLTG